MRPSGEEARRTSIKVDTGRAGKAMNKIKIQARINRLSWRMMLIGLAVSTDVSAVPRSGEAVVADRVGSVQARIFPDSVHAGRTEVVELSRGSAIGENSRIMTGKDGRISLVLSPGAILCVEPETELTFRELRRSSDGLPKSEADLVRHIDVELHKGRIEVQAGTPTPSLDIRIRTNAGEIEAHGGKFIVAQAGEKEWVVRSEKQEVGVTPEQGGRVMLSEGGSASLTVTDEGVGRFEQETTQAESLPATSDFFNDSFVELAPFIQDDGGYDRSGLSQYIGAEEGLEFVGSVDTALDVSPATRTVVKNEKRGVPTAGQPGTQTRWDQQRVWAWYENIGVVKGVNYIPRNAVNSTEMWMKETFNPELINEELGWAHDAGYTTLRVQLQYAVWKDDPQGFLDRAGQFIEIAARHSLQVVPVLFDDLNFAQEDPVVGPQPEPIPGQNNSRWTPSPGAAAVKDTSVWPDLEKYVKSVIDQFKKNDQVVYWDLYNRTGAGGRGEESLPLMEQTFNWAREVDPRQPLAVAAWNRPDSAMSARMLERSDVITFQSFENADQVEKLLASLQRYNRPVICSDWLMRQKGNNFETLLPLFSVRRVGWFNQGLVSGKTQKRIQQDSVHSTNPDVWQSDVLREDGQPYDSEEIKRIQEFRFQNTGEKN